MKKRLLVLTMALAMVMAVGCGKKEASEVPAAVETTEDAAVEEEAVEEEAVE